MVPKEQAWFGHVLYQLSCNLLFEGPNNSTKFSLTRKKKWIYFIHSFYLALGFQNYNYGRRGHSWKSSRRYSSSRRKAQNIEKRRHVLKLSQDEAEDKANISRQSFEKNSWNPPQILGILWVEWMDAADSSFNVILENPDITWSQFEYCYQR